MLLYGLGFFFPSFKLFNIVEPFQQKFYLWAISVNSYFNKGNYDEVYKENRRLKKENNELIIENVKLTIYKSENEKLKKLMNFYDNELQNSNFVAGRVIGKLFDNKSILIINLGQKQNLKEGYPVVAQRGVLVGKTFEVFPNYSKVRLLTDSQSKVVAALSTNNSAQCILKGKYGLSIFLDLIPQDISITDNDIVISSGLEKNIPKGLILGKVASVEESPNDLFKKAYVIPTIAYEKLDIVSVIVPN
jgi:rod shape-determining protein MreC